MRALLLIALLLAGCGEIWNDPYPAAERGRNILYSVFSDRPKHLDPAQSYASDEATFTRQVYEPPLQYHYLKRPYELIPLTAAEIPQPPPGREERRDLQRLRHPHQARHQVPAAPGLRCGEPDA